ncbi:tape measure protein [Mycolicibacterium porcinum]|uniref:tape measure protein n=1 Tax=Mycolicibacterium porcinum TaxID=39693 RepID=UPI0011937A5B|nr:tape measure protein [Mycolicibacterium porcinum]TVX97853.1 tape measure protein [Mycolicibacterium porcinum]
MATGIELATAYVSLTGETRQLSKDINRVFAEADRASGRSAKTISKNLDAGFAGSRGSAARAGTDAAREYERALQSSIRGEKIGAAIGAPIGKGIGLAIKGGIGVAAAGATAAVGLLATSLTKGFTRLKNIDNATFKLKALGHSAEDVKAIMDSAQKSVKGTAFGLDAAANTAATATAAGVPTGQGLTDYLSNVADAAAIAQTSLDDMGSIFNKVQTNGKAMTDDLQMLADRGLPIFTWLQKQYGVSGEALQKMVEDGKVSAADFQRAVHDNIAGSAKKMGESFEGSLQNLDAAMGRFGATLLGVPFDSASGGIGTLTTALDKLDGWVKSHQAGLIDFWTVLGKAGAFAAQSILQHASDMAGAWAGLVAAFGNVMGAVNKFQAWQADVRGDHDTANELRALSEEQFGWGEDLYKLSAQLGEAADNAGNFYGKLDQWADKAKAAATMTTALGDSFVKVNENGQIIVQSNAMDKLEELNKLELVVKNLPDGSFEVVPGTPEAQKLIDAFVAKNGVLPPATLPVDVDTSAAQAKLQNLYNDIFKVPAGYQPQTAAPSTNNMLLPAGPATPGTPGGYMPYDPKAWERPKFGGGRARGGPIGGSGPKGKDSVLIMAAPGEHMLTADEVDMLGGQGGAYALRAAIRAGAMSKQGVVMFPPEPIGPSDKNTPGGVPDLRPGKNPNQIGLPDWSTPGQGWGAPPPGWWVKPINPDDYLLPEWWPPGHDYWKHPYDKNRIKPFSVPGYENGGAIGAIDYAYNQAGKPYQYGAFDCSMLASQVYARMAGLPPGRYFATDSDFAALGFKKGYKPGALNIGTNGGSGTNGHMAVTLPNGVNAENAGSAGSMYGGAAKGANDFSQQWYYEPPNSGDMGDLQANGMQASGAAHGMTAGAAPGPVGADGQPVTPGSGATPTDSGRTEGYIPAGAGNTSVAGTSFMSGIYNMGAEAINGLIDQAASAAATAASAAATAGSFGAGGQAAGPAAAFAIGMGANAAKRGVSYGAQMLGIGTDALVEQLTPFGAPRWLSTDPTAFMPQGLTSAATTSLEQMMQGGDQPQAAGQQPVEPATPQAPVAPQANLTQPSPDDLHPAENNGITIGSITGMDPDQVGNELLKVQRYNALQYQGRP